MSEKRTSAIALTMDVLQTCTSVD